MFELMRDFTAPYSRLDAFIYDRYVAPAAAKLVESFHVHELASLPSGARVLDVGCGGGHNALAIASRRNDLEVIGLDLSSDQIGRARKRAERAGLDEGSALELPFADQSFDLVMSVASIKHWPDRQAGARECARVTRAGGRLVIGEADRGCHLDDARAFVAMWRAPRPLRPILLAAFRTWVAGQGLDLDEARDIAARLPLDDVEVERTEGAPAVVIRGRRVD